jgi:predicted flap endonuclease-1-like 5' DNA nuclease
MYSLPSNKYERQRRTAIDNSLFPNPRTIFMPSIIDIEGIGEVFAKKLQAAGIDSTEALLKAGATAEDRQTLAANTGIAGALILKWVNRADLFRIKGVGEQYSDLLEAAGVDSVVELAQRRADNLHQKLLETNRTKKLVRVVPGAERVADWVRQAGKLSRAVSH